jgi:hypothetical protein
MTSPFSVRRFLGSRFRCICVVVQRLWIYEIIEDTIANSKEISPYSAGPSKIKRLG